MNLVYKVCSKDEWDQAIINQFYSGSDVDNKDGFIHLSTKRQLNETVTKHFRGKKNLLVISFSTKKIQDNLKWEVSISVWWGTLNHSWFDQALRKKIR